VAREQAAAELVSHQGQVRASATGLLSEVLCCRPTLSLQLDASSVNQAWVQSWEDTEMFSAVLVVRADPEGSQGPWVSSRNQRIQTTQARKRPYPTVLYHGPTGVLPK